MRMERCHIENVFSEPLRDESVTLGSINVEDKILTSCYEADESSSCSYDAEDP